MIIIYETITLYSLNNFGPVHERQSNVNRDVLPALKLHFSLDATPLPGTSASVAYDLDLRPNDLET